MKTLVSALTAAAIAAGAVAPAAAAPVCLTSYLIDHTSVQKDNQTILFYMKDGKVFANTLMSACPSLHFHGYVMNIPGGNETICSNQQSIRVLVTNEVCQMGAFTPYTPAAKVQDKS
jgi:hypothetical protein